MRMKYLALTLLAGLPLQAAAQESRPQEPAANADRSEIAAPLSAQELEGISGGDAVVIETVTGAVTEQTLEATVTDNTITAGSVTSGAVNFGSNALNFNGIGNFVVNTGNNNVLQGSLSVTVINGAPVP
jgi:hypothetical protein